MRCCVMVLTVCSYVNCFKHKSICVKYSINFFVCAYGFSATNETWGGGEGLDAWVWQKRLVNLVTINRSY